MRTASAEDSFYPAESPGGRKRYESAYLGTILRRLPEHRPQQPPDDAEHGRADQTAFDGRKHATPLVPGISGAAQLVAGIGPEEASADRSDRQPFPAIVRHRGVRRLRKARGRSEE